MLLATSFVDRSWSLQCRRISPPSKTKDMDWPSYGGPQGDRYSPLSQINRDTVGCLQVAWTYDTHELGGLQTHPLIVGRRMFVYTPQSLVPDRRASFSIQLRTERNDLADAAPAVSS
jgi:glucose dehydrogenase